jgi:hypothetical protein
MYRVTPVLPPPSKFLLGGVITEIDRNGLGKAPPIFEAKNIERAVQNALNLDRNNDHVTAIAAFVESGLPASMLPDHMKLSFANQRIYRGARLGNIGGAFGGAVPAKTGPRNQAEIAIPPRHGNIPATTTTAHAPQG